MTSSRRRCLIGGAALLSVVTAGCLGTGERSDPSPDDTDRGGTETLWVANYDTKTHRLAVSVAVEPTGATLLDEVYELPSNKGVRYDRFLAHGESYTIEATKDGHVTETSTVDVGGCGDDPMSPGGDQPYLVQAFDASERDADGLATVARACDVDWGRPGLVPVEDVRVTNESAGCDCDESETAER